jgi:hypothetical protein
MDMSVSPIGLLYWNEMLHTRHSGYAAGRLLWLESLPDKGLHAWVPIDIVRIEN